MGLCQDAVYKYEAGKREMSVRMMVRASEVLNASYTTILAGLKDDGSAPYAGMEFNVLAPTSTAILMKLATEWNGDIDALIIFMAMVASWPEDMRREMYMHGTIINDRLLDEGVISPDQQPPGMDFMLSQIGKLYQSQND